MNRAGQLDGLKVFIKEKQSLLNSILNELGWTEENVLKNRENEVKTKTEDPNFPKSLPWSNSTVIDDEILKEILKSSNMGGTSKSFNSQDLSRSEKLAVYEYVISHTRKLIEPEISVSIKSEDGKKEMTFAEIVAMKRDLKRRRQRYRTTKCPPLSQTEEIRNLIELQMQALQQYHLEQNSNRNEDENLKTSTEMGEYISSPLKPENEKRHSRGRSRSRSHKRKKSKGSHKHKRSYSRKADRHRRSSSRTKKKSRKSKKSSKFEVRDT